MTQKQSQVNYVAVFEIPATVRIPLSVVATDQQSALVKGFDLVRELTPESVTAYLSLMTDHAINVSLDRAQVEHQAAPEADALLSALVDAEVSTTAEGHDASNKEAPAPDVAQANFSENPPSITGEHPATDAEVSQKPLVLPDGSLLVLEELDTATAPAVSASAADTPEVDALVPLSPLDAMGACFKLQLFSRHPSNGAEPFEEVPSLGFKAAEALALDAVKPAAEAGLSKAGFARVKDFLGFTSFEIKAERGDWELEVLDASGSLAHRKSWISTESDAKTEFKQALRSYPSDFKFYLLNCSDREAGPIVVKKVY